MSKISTDLRLATTPTEYNAITREVEQLCDVITHHGESSCANALFALLEQLTELIATFKDSSAETRLWRDAFCEECSTGHEIIDGTARELAQKILDLGWSIDPDRPDYLNCPKCARQLCAA